MNEDLNLLDLEIGSDLKSGTIISKYIETIPNPKNPDAPRKKLLLKVMSDNFEYTVSEMWVQNYKKEQVVKGFWIDFDKTDLKLHTTSVLVSLMNHLKIRKLSELIGQTVTIKPKDNNFMAIVLDN